MMGTVHLGTPLPHLERSEAASIVTISSVSRPRVASRGALRPHGGRIIHYTQALPPARGQEHRANSLSPPGHTLLPRAL